MQRRKQNRWRMHEFPPLQVPPLQSPPLVISATRSNPNLSPQGAPAGPRGRRREEGGVRVTSSVQLVRGETDGLKRRWREASSPPRVTVTVGSSTRINMNSREVAEEEEEKEGGLDGTYSLPNLSLLRAEARARRPHMGTSRFVIPSFLHTGNLQKHTPNHASFQTQ